MKQGLFESAFRFSTIGAVLVSTEGKLLKVNPSMSKMLGYSENELLGLNFITITHPEDIEADINVGTQMLNGETNSFQMEKRFISKSGSIIYGLISGCVIRKEDDSIDFFLSQVQDITELKETQLKLQNNAKLVALGEMAAGIAHEINNPLTIINLHSRALDMMVKEPEIDRQMVLNFSSKITETVKRISSIVSSLRKFSSKDNSLSSFEFHPVSAILEDALGMCQEKFKAAGVSLDISIPDELQIECNSVDVSQVFINLINNAFYAIRDQAEKQISISAQKMHNMVVISVMDSGPEIPHEIRKKILDPFFTTKPMGEGTGLGLSISRSIVQSHQGELYLDESSLKTNFVVKLPIEQVHLKKCSDASSTASKMLAI